MAKQIQYFNATKKIGNVIFNYNNKFDENFVNSIIKYVNESILMFKNKKIKINLNELKNGEMLKIYIYPTVKLFNQTFYSEIDRRFHSGKKTIGEIYIVQTSDNNIHVAVPRGRSSEFIETLKGAVVSQILAEYTSEKDKLVVNRVIKETIKEINIKKKEEQEKSKDLEEEKEEQEPEEPEEELEEIESKEEEPEKLSESEMEDIYLVETKMIEEQKKAEESIKKQEQEQIKEKTNKKEKVNAQSKQWLLLGWIMYRTNKLKEGNNLDKFSIYIKKKGLTKFSKLRNSKLFEASKYEAENACAFVDFLINKFGTKRFMEVFNDPSILKESKIFGMSKFQFEVEAKKHILENYKPEKSKKTIKPRVKEIISFKEKIEGRVDINMISKDPIIVD